MRSNPNQVVPVQEPLAQKLWYQSLLSCAAFISFVLLCTSIYTTYKYFSYRDVEIKYNSEKLVYGNWDTNYAFVTYELLPTVEYYDWNVNQNPIFKQQWGQSTCEAGFKQVKNIFTWPGNVIGCVESGKITTGKCASTAGSQIDETGTAVLYKWKTGMFCVTEWADPDGQLRVPKKTGENCPTSYTQCNECFCFKDSSGCPVTDWKIYDSAQSAAVTAYGGTTNAKNQQVLDSITWKAYYKITAKKPFYIGPHVELYGKKCLNPKLHPSPPSIHYSILKVIGQGCKKFGQDSALNKVSDSVKEWSFYKDNTATMTSARINLPQYKITVDKGEGYAYLQGLYQIERDCSPECQNFRFGLKAKGIVKEYNVIWRRMKWIAFISMTFTATAFILVFWVNHKLKSSLYEQSTLWSFFVEFIVIILLIIALYMRAWSFAIVLFVVLIVCVFAMWLVKWVREERKKRAYFVLVYVMLIIFLVVLTIMLWTACYRIKKHFNSRRVHFIKVEQKACIKNDQWAEVLKQWNLHLNLDGVYSVLFWFQIFYAIFALLATVFFFYGMSKIKSEYEFKYSELQNQNNA